MTASETETLGLRANQRPSRRTIATVVTGLAATALLARFAVAVAVNAPVGPSTSPLELIEQGTTGLAALAAAWLGATEDEPMAGVGLLFVGVFGLLSAVVGLAIPAAVAVVAGTAAVAVAVREDLTPVTAVATVLLVGGLAVSLVGGLGATTLRPIGSTLALLAVAATPAFAATDRRALVGGAVAFAAVVAFGLANPFVTGAITLVGSGVVGSSLPVVALAVAGAVTTGSAALRERRWALLSGVALIAFAGVPGTLARAIPFALGITTLLTLGVGE